MPRTLRHVSANRTRRPHRALVVATLVACLLGVIAGTAPSLGAQSVRRDSAAVAALRACPRSRCEVALERGTLRGNRLRVGTDTATIPFGTLSVNVVRHLSVMPEAAHEAELAERAQQRRFVTGLVTAGGVLAVALLRWRLAFADAYDRQELAAPAVSTRIVAAAAVAGTGMFVAGRFDRAASRRLDEAVRRYNEQLQP